VIPASVAEFNSLALRWRCEVGRKIARVGHGRPFQQHRNNQNITAQRTGNFAPHQVVGIVQPASGGN